VTASLFVMGTPAWSGRRDLPEDGGSEAAAGVAPAVARPAVDGLKSSVCGVLVTATAARDWTLAADDSRCDECARIAGQADAVSSPRLAALMSHPDRGRCLHVDMTTHRGGDMASSTRVPPTEITGVQGALLRTISRRMLGQVPEGLGVMWHYPALLKDTMKFGRRTESWNRLDPHLATFATMAAAAVIGCSFCLDLHYL